MNEQPKLTIRQQEIFELIQRTVSQTGAPPTRAEIASAMNFRSANAAEEHLRALARKGVIELVGGTSRGIRLNAGTLLTVNQSRQHFSTSDNRRVYTKPLPGLEQLCLPLVGRVAAGRPILAQASIERTYNIEAHLFAQRPDYLLRVRGMSMRDAGIIEEDLLAVAKTSVAMNGQIVVARLGDEVTVKRFKQSASGIQLLSENSDFKAILVTPETGEFAIEGRAVGLIRNSF